MSIDPAPSPADSPVPAGSAPPGGPLGGGRRFADFPLSPDILEALADLGFTSAVPVQAATLEPILAGRDVLVRAKPGSGRTAAFCVPIVERTERERRTRALILAPPKSLIPIGQTCAAIAKYRDANLAVLDVAAPVEPQVQLLAGGVEIVIGAPARVRELHQRRALDLSGVQVVCLDGADELLAAASDDVTALLDATPPDRQVLVFAMALTDEIAQLAGVYLKDPEQVQIATPDARPSPPQPASYDLGDGDRLRALLAVLDVEAPDAAALLCPTSDEAAALASFLDRQGYDAQLMSAEALPARRAQDRVRCGEVQFLVATEEAARGLDRSALSHVLVVRGAVVEVHRRSATGPIGALPAPDPAAAAQLRAKRHARRIREATGALVFEAYLPTVHELQARPDGQALLAAAVRAFFHGDRQHRVAASEWGRRGERRAQKRDRGGDKGAAGHRSAPEEQDVLLIAAAPPTATLVDPSDDDADRKRKKRRRRRKKGKDREDELIPASNPTDEEGDAGEGDESALDDLDALLTTD